MSHAYDYPRMGTTVDAVVFYIPRITLLTGCRINPEEISVLLITRKNSPYKHHQCLPGGYVDMNEIFAQAASRELEEETSTLIRWNEFELVGVYDSIGRDPRERTISVAYYTITTELLKLEAKDDAEDAMWLSVEVALGANLGFDHSKILREAYDKLCDNLNTQNSG